MSLHTFTFSIGHPANELQFGIAILKEMRRSNVPVIGGLWPQGCEYGKLEVTSDPLEGKLTYIWDDEGGA